MYKHSLVATAAARGARFVIDLQVVGPGRRSTSACRSRMWEAYVTGYPLIADPSRSTSRSAARSRVVVQRREGAADRRAETGERPGRSARRSSNASRRSTTRNVGQVKPWRLQHARTWRGGSYAASSVRRRACTSGIRGSQNITWTGGQAPGSVSSPTRGACRGVESVVWLTQRAEESCPHGSASAGHGLAETTDVLRFRQEECSASFATMKHQGNDSGRGRRRVATATRPA